MSTYTYLVRKSNKSFYELGTCLNWSTDLDLFKVNKIGNLLSNDIFDEESDIVTLQINDREILTLTLHEHFLSDYYEYSLSLDSEYIDYVTNSILDFCDNETVYLLNDNFETYHILKNEFGYKQTGSRYIN